MDRTVAGAAGCRGNGGSVEVRLSVDDGVECVIVMEMLPISVITELCNQVCGHIGTQLFLFLIERFLHC